jgi:hypothetical protein
MKTTKVIKKATLKDKLLDVICKMEVKRAQTLKNEDVYVKAFKAYPDDFHLRGYREYPDTEIMSKRIYDLRKAGFIQITKKFIKLTEKGRNQVKLSKGKSIQRGEIKNALSRDVENEVKRILQTEAYKLFMAGKQNEIVDSDLYAFLGAAVKTERTTFEARIQTVNDAIQAYCKIYGHDELLGLSDYLFDKFKDIIDTKLQTGYPRRSHE